jgi:hypothetical protein
MQTHTDRRSPSQVIVDLVHALGRSAGGAKLPSAGLCLNPSKAASHLDEATIFLHFVCREAEIRPLMVGRLCSGP